MTGHRADTRDMPATLGEPDPVSPVGAVDNAGLSRLSGPICAFESSRKNPAGRLAAPGEIP